ncbi:MAG: glycosyltransferase [Clostridiales bacterium]|nr:glycosyltransferase [Clostridiales bacterium]
MSVKLSVIIVSYKNIQVLTDCLGSIRQYNDIGDALEVIVSDNSPDNELFDTVKRSYDWIKIIKNKNDGFGAGNNRGVEISSGEILLFLNPDTVLVEPIFKFALDKFEEDSDLALFGVQLIKPDGSNNASFFMYDQYGILATLKEKYRRKKGKFIDKNMFICGADLFVRKESFDEAGRFDENIFMYKEEPDLIKRIKLHSTAKKVAFFGNKKIIHLEGGTESESASKKLTVLDRLLVSDRYYAKKWGLSYNKIVKSRIKYARFKKNIYSLLFKKQKSAEQKKIIQFLKSKLD